MSNSFEALNKLLESTPTADLHQIALCIERQFTLESACTLFDEGQREFEQGRINFLPHEVDGPDSKVMLTESALRDLNVFSQTKKEVIQILNDLPSRIGSSSCHAIPRPNGFIVKQDALRFVFAESNEQIVVMCIANAGINPVGKVWRYFTQSKAENLLTSSELYFRRTDLLSADPYECRLPTKVIEARKRALENVYPGKSSEFTGGFEIRDSTYVCCWTMREHESYLAWKHYCCEHIEPGCKEGGFAIQTTQRRMLHLHAKLRASDGVYCRQIGYLDHWQDDLPSHEAGEEAFWKAHWFSDERELRLAIIDPKSWSNSPDWKKSKAPEGRRVPVDLDNFVEAIVINPFIAPDDRKHLNKLLVEHRPNLTSRVRESVITKKPPLETIK